MHGKRIDTTSAMASTYKNNNSGVNLIVLLFGFLEPRRICCLSIKRLPFCLTDAEFSMPLSDIDPIVENSQLKTVHTILLLLLEVPIWNCCWFFFIRILFSHRLANPRSTFYW